MGGGGEIDAQAGRYFRKGGEYIARIFSRGRNICSKGATNIGGRF